MRTPLFRRAAAPLATLMLAAAMVSESSSPATAAPFANVTLNVTRVVELDDPDPGPTQGDGDFYARVTIGSNPAQTSGEHSGEDFNPGWSFSGPVDLATPSAKITVELFDADGVGAEPDDVIDLNPRDRRWAVELSYDAYKNVWAGEVPTNQTFLEGEGDREHFGFTEGGEKGRLEFNITSSAAGPDTDGDGLLDAWETGGFDADGDGNPDLPLNQWGADPNHKDVFLELDWSAGNAPSRESIQAMKRAFASAPADAGSQAATLPGGLNAPANPDGRPGINLWVDTGTLVDANAREGQVAGTCNDGVNNNPASDLLVDGADPDCRYLDASVEDPRPGNCTNGTDDDTDGLADSQDPDCLVGDNLGGGTQVTDPNVCNFGPAWYNAKNGMPGVAPNFNPQRATVFRYSTSFALAAGCTSSGGWGEIGGNDFMDFNHDGGTIFHELGHTLNLRHGGFEDANCKPNYVSAMNYDNQFGINRTGGGTIIDFAPARLALDGTTRGTLPGPLQENNLDEPTILLASDAVNQFAFVDSAGAKVRVPMNQTPNWNADTDPPLDQDLTVNIDTNATGGGPAACANAVSNSTLASADDWRIMSLPFRQFGDAADGAVNPWTIPEPDLAELNGLRDALNSADLSVTVAESVDPVAAGTDLSWTIQVGNNGKNPSSSTQVAHILPVATTFMSASAGCQDAAGVVTCAVGELAPGASRTLSITGRVAPDAVYDNGGPLSLSAETIADNLVGPDPDESNNHVTTSTLAVAVADLRVTGVGAVNPPTEIVIGQPTTVKVITGVANAGPSAPMDVRLDRTAVAAAGATVTPASDGATLTAVGTGLPAVSAQTYTVSCEAPGSHAFTFTSRVAPANGADTDPNLGNNEQQSSFTVDCIVPIAVNIKPGGDPNSINRGAKQDIPLAALTTSAGEYGLPLAFDATRIIVALTRFGSPTTIAAGGGALESHAQAHFEDALELDEATRDGDTDNVLHYGPAGAGFVMGDREGCLKGKFLSTDGNVYTFLGCGPVRIVK